MLLLLLILLYYITYTPYDCTCQLRNTENDLFNPNNTFYISVNKYITLINSFGLGRHLLRQDIVTCTDATLGCFKKKSFNIHIIRYVNNFMFGYWTKINK